MTRRDEHRVGATISNEPRPVPGPQRSAHREADPAAHGPPADPGAGTIVASTRTTADASAIDPADGRGSTEAASTARTSQAIPASIQRRYLERDSQRSTTTGTGLVGDVTM